MSTLTFPIFKKISNVAKFFSYAPTGTILCQGTQILGQAHIRLKKTPLHLLQGKILAPVELPCSLC